MLRQMERASPDAVCLETVYAGSPKPRTFVVMMASVSVM